MISICWTHKQDNKRYVLTTAYPDTVLNAEQRDPCILEHMFKLKPLNQNWQFNNPLLYVYKYLLNVRRKVKEVLGRNCRKYAGHWTTGTKEYLNGSSSDRVDQRNYTYCKTPMHSCVS